MNSPEALVAFRTTWPYSPEPAAALLPTDEEQTQVLRREDLSFLSPQTSVLVFPQDTWEMGLAVDRLQSQEGVPLVLEVRLEVRLVDPHAFWLDVMHREERLTEADFQRYLSDLIRRAVGPYLATRSLAELDTPGIRTALEEHITHYIRQEDVPTRSGIELNKVGVEGLRFRVREEGREARDVYLAHSLPSTRRDAVSVARTPILRGVREAVSRTAGPRSVWRMPSSAFRPERWRYALQRQVTTAPLVHEGRLYVAAEDGTVFAFTREAPAVQGKEHVRLFWPNPPRLPTRPGLGMAIAAGMLWVPGENGVLYGLRLSDGHIVREVNVGGRLRSAPTVVGGSLYVATDKPRQALRSEHGGRLVRVDPRSGGIVKDVKLGSRGLRARPVRWGEFLFLTDRRNTLYRVDLHLERVDAWPLRGVGRLLAGVTVEPQSAQVIVVDGAPGYGTVVALNVHGEEQGRTRLPGTIVAPPLVWQGRLFVPVSGNRQRGYLYRLDPHTLDPIEDPVITDGPVTASPVGFEDVVIFGSHDGLVYAVWAESGNVFWKYHSGSRVLAPPVVTQDGLVYVVDEAGNISALPWYGANVTEGARWATEQGHVEEAIRLWEEAGDIEAALDIAEKHKRWGMATDIAFRYEYYERAALYAEQAARFLEKRGREEESVHWWRRAAEAWERTDHDLNRSRCLEKAAQLARWPLLQIALLNRPRIQRGGLAQLQLEVKNVGGGPARDVEIEVRGMVEQVERKVLRGVIEPKGRRQPVVHVYPSVAGMASLIVCARWRLPDSYQVHEEYRRIVLSVDKEPEVHHHYHGAYVRIGGDGVVILREEKADVHADIGGDGVVIGGKGRGHVQFHLSDSDDVVVRDGTEFHAQFCPNCRAPVKPEHTFCGQCGYRLRKLPDG